MKMLYQKFLKHVFFYTVAPLVILVAIISYFRFFINHDYIIGYEGICDPEKDTCFIGCEDDACTEEYYYSKVQKYAADLYKECGPNITDCEYANVCLPGDRNCSVVYCENSTSDETCSLLNKKINTLDEENTNTTEKELLQKNNTKNTQ